MDEPTVEETIKDLLSCASFGSIVHLRLFTQEDALNLLVQTQHEQRNVSFMGFCFGGDSGGPELPNNHWEPLLREIETLPLIKHVNIEGSPSNDSCLLPLYRFDFFPALQRNQNIEEATLKGIDFSVQSDSICAYMEGASFLQQLKLERCSDPGLRSSAAIAVRRNAHIKTLSLIQCDATIVYPVLRGLASPDSVSTLTKLVYKPTGRGSDLQTFRQYLESPHATIRCLELCAISYFGPEFFSILDSLSTNAQIDDVVLNCEHLNLRINERSIQSLITCIRNKPNLSALRLRGGTFGPAFQSVFDSVVDILPRPGGALHCLDIGVTRMAWLMPPLSFLTLLAAVSRSTRLEHLRISHIRARANDGYDRPYFEFLLQAIPMFKMKTLDLEISTTIKDDDALLNAIKRNYCIQNVTVSSYLSKRWSKKSFRQSRLEFYLRRNAKLAQWVENPKIVPSNLLPNAIQLAQEAGKDTLYLSLLKLAGEGVGLRKRGRKRNCPECFKPSDRL